MTYLSKPPFPAVIDSSMMAAAKSCGRKVELEFFEHWKPRTPSVHLHAGAAYAKGMEAARTAYYVNQESPENAVAAGLQACFEAYGSFECPADSAKSLERTVGAVEYYFSRYPLETEKATPIILPGGKLGIEFSFLEPIDLKHPESGDPLLLSGRFDMICNFENMQLGEDDKTASQLGASWPRQWDLRSQFTAYCWGAGKSQIKLDGFLVRGLSILKTKYDTLQAITYRPAWMIERWYEQLLRDTKRLIQQWEEGYFDFNLDHACAEYGGCPFRGVCQMKDPAALLQSQFERRRWDPVTRTETVIEDALPDAKGG